MTQLSNLKYHDATSNWPSEPILKSVMRRKDYRGATIRSESEKEFSYPIKRTEAAFDRETKMSREAKTEVKLWN